MSSKLVVNSEYCNGATFPVLSNYFYFKLESGNAMSLLGLKHFDFSSIFFSSDACAMWGIEFSSFETLAHPQFLHSGF